MPPSYSKEIEYLENLLEKGINGTAKFWIEHLIQNPHEINFDLLAGTRRGQAETWDKMTNSIVEAWRYKRFILFADGRRGHCFAPNLKMVSPDDALLNHWDDRSWAVDWDAELNAAQIQLVLNPHWRAGLTFRASS